MKIREKSNMDTFVSGDGQLKDLLLFASGRKIGGVGAFVFNN